MIVIGLTGYARAGKDTVADILVKDYGFTKKSFAGPLKTMLRTLDPIVAHDYDYDYDDGSCGDPDCCGGYLPPAPIIEERRLSDLNGYTEDDLKESFPEYRRLLQVLGTDCVRAMDPEFWINAARREVLTAGPDARIVFTDCRFPNEADMIRELDFMDNSEAVVARVHGRVKPDLSGAHSSEQHVGHMDEEWTVYNTGDLDQLVDEVAELAKLVGVERVPELAA